MKLLNYFLLFLFLSSSFVIAQEFDIVPYLVKIEQGNGAEAQSALPKLKTEHPNDPSVMFLDAVLTTNGDEALNKYLMISQNYPNSRFADAALYRVFSYYYSMGYYTRAGEYLNKLKAQYPNSPYIKAADRNIPDVEEVPQQTQTVATEKNVPLEKFNYTIQAGAFLNTQNAMNLKSKFEQDGYFADIKTKEVGGSILNVVTLGKFATENDATTTLNYLKNKHNLNGRVVPYTR